MRPEQVTIIGISHYHFDHIGQAASFPHARLIMGPGDLAALRSGQPGVNSAPLAPWLTGGGQVTEANGDHDVFGDGKVIVLNLPGHTPGHRGLLVRLRLGPGAALRRPLSFHRAGAAPRRAAVQHQPRRHARLDGPVRPARRAICGANVIIQHEPADVAKLPAFPQSAR